jgi:predicted ATPase
VVKAGEIEELRRQVQGYSQKQMLRQLTEAVDALAADAVVVLVFEDLQWSDTATLEVVAYLAQRRWPARLYILGTYRPAEVVVKGHPLRRVIQELYGRRQCEELALELLTEAEVEEYLTRGFGCSAAVSALSKTIYNYTDGNALFVVNFVDYLLQRKLLIAVDGQWKVRAESTVLKDLVPETLQQLITWQIERLTLEEQHLLEVASVSGRTFSAVEVAKVMGRALEEVEEVYDALASTGQFIAGAGVMEWPDGTVTVRYEFRHALYQQVLYEQLGQGQRIISANLSSCGEEVEAVWRKDTEEAQESRDELADAGLVLSPKLERVGNGDPSQRAVTRVSLRGRVDACAVVARGAGVFVTRDRRACADGAVG